jgi:hypothetical protein
MQISLTRRGSVGVHIFGTGFGVTVAASLEGQHRKRLLCRIATSTSASVGESESVETSDPLGLVVDRADVERLERGRRVMAALSVGRRSGTAGSVASSSWSIACR